jgi:hypothetical protein
MLEFGGGDSTAWFARRVDQLATVEPDPTWCEHIRAATIGQDNVLLVPATIATAMADPPLIPADATRSEVAIWASNLAPAPRLIIVDDSDKPGLRDAFATLERDYEARSFHGFKARPLRLVETTVFIRREAS